MYLDFLNGVQQYLGSRPKPADILSAKLPAETKFLACTFFVSEPFFIRMRLTLGTWLLTSLLGKGFFSENSPVHGCVVRN